MNLTGSVLTFFLLELHAPSIWPPSKAHCNVHTHCFLMCDRNTFIFNFKKLKDNVRKWIMLPLLPWQAKALKASSFSGVTSAAKFSKILAWRLVGNNVSCFLASPRLNAIKSIPIETVSFFHSLILKSTARVNQWNLLFMVRAESKVFWSYPALWSSIDELLEFTEGSRNNSIKYDARELSPAYIKSTFCSRFVAR